MNPTAQLVPAHISWLNAPTAWPGLPGISADRFRTYCPCGEYYRMLNAWELSTARDSMNWVTVRLIMRIAQGVAAAARAAELEQCSWKPAWARAGLARAARLSRGSLPRARAQLHRRTSPSSAWPVRCVPQARRVVASAQALRHRRPGLVRRACCGARHPLPS